MPLFQKPAQPANRYSRGEVEKRRKQREQVPVMHGPEFQGLKKQEISLLIEIKDLETQYKSSMIQWNQQFEFWTTNSANIRKHLVAGNLPEANAEIMRARLASSILMEKDLKENISYYNTLMMDKLDQVKNIRAHMAILNEENYDERTQSRSG